VLIAAAQLVQQKVELARNLGGDHDTPANETEDNGFLAGEMGEPFGEEPPGMLAVPEVHLATHPSLLSAALAARRVGVIVHVRDRIVFPALVCFGPVLVRMDEERMVVLVAVIVRAMGKLAQWPARVLVRHVPVVMHVNLCRVPVLMRLVANDLLLGADIHLLALRFQLAALAVGQVRGRGV